MKKILRELLAMLLALTVLLAVCAAASSLLIPPRTAFGLNWKSFAQEPRDSIDVIYLGSSVAYCDVCPALIYDSAGLSGYVVAGPEQTAAMSYYYLLQALKTQSPRAVALELSGMYFNYYGAYADSNASYLPFGRVKLEAIFSAVNPSSRLELLFPILAYHDRSYTFSVSDIRDNLLRKADPYAGCTPLLASGAPGEVSARDTGDGAFYEQAVEYLGRLKALCDEEDIDLYVYLAPAVSRIEGDSLSRLEADIASLGIENYRDFSHGEAFEALGLEPDRDWTDGLHLSFSGSLKFCPALADFIGRTAPSGRADAELWRERVELIAALRMPGES